jgi:hypothetical protein
MSYLKETEGVVKKFRPWRCLEGPYLFRGSTTGLNLKDIGALVADTAFTTKNKIKIS